jgi:hypothetical protein
MYKRILNCTILNKRKTLCSITILLLLLAVTSIFAVALPEATAQLPTQQTWAFISISPNPVGIGQPMHIRLFLQPFPPTGSDVYHGFQYTITQPNGQKKTGSNLNSDTNGAYDLSFTPTAAGNYTVTFTYPGEDFTRASVTDLGSTASTTFEVQEAQVLPIPDAPLPSGYWTRPISEEFRSWFAISGNWLVQGYDASGRIYGDSTGFNPYTQAVRAPHIMWAQSVQDGGLIGGSYGSDGYYTGIQYNGLVTPPLVVNGRLYYRTGFSSSGEKGNINGVDCVDLRTGKLIWSNDTAGINFAQVYDAKGYNGQGGLSMIYDTSGSTSVWTVLSAFDGTELFTVYGTSAMGNPDKIFYGPLGDVYAVKVTGNTTKPTILMWNSTKAFQAWGFLSGGSMQGLPRMGSYNWTQGLQYNTTAPSTAPFTFSQSGPHNEPADAATNTIMLIATPSQTPNNGSSYETGINILDGSTLWGPIRRDFDGTFTNRVATGEGLYVQLNAATIQRVGISFTTGQQLWTSEPNPELSPWGQYSGFGANAYGITFQGDYSGHMVALNASTGQKLWSYYAGNSGLETPYGSWPMFNGPIIGGGTVYCGYSEHTPNEPLYRGAQLFALDAQSGRLLWSMPSYLTVKAIADGYLVTMNAYDNRLIVFGKGPSATTVQAPLIAVQAGTTMMITGTVTDQSPGAKDTPAISDTDMANWMEYLYMQKAMPTNATGVPVQVSAIGPDGVAIPIGEVNSNIGGTYGIEWTPSTAGKYMITATFAGSDSYSSSYATTYVSVSSGLNPSPVVTPTPTIAPTTAAPTTAAPTTTAPQPGNNNTTIIYVAVAAVVVIVVIAAVALALRRRK